MKRTMVEPSAAQAAALAQRAYTTAVTLYGQKRHADAAKVFLSLLLKDPGDARYHKGNGACLQMMGLHEKACVSYALALALNPTDTVLLFHLSECFFAVGATQEATEAAQEFLTATEGRSDMAAMRHRAHHITFHVNHQEPA